MPRSPAHSSPEAAILQALLEKDGRFVSGSDLAARLNMSRVAVWQHMEKMREQGFRFESARARGYRLQKKPPALTPLLIQAHLALMSVPVEFVFLDTVDSTNDEATRRLAAGHATPLVVAARAQTRGRGRFGRVWHSEDNGNLYLSFAFRPLLPPARMQTFTLWMGANLCDFVANYTQITPGLKWPNDILFDGRKAGGMLTEARIDADQIRDLVFGLGLNINSQTKAFPAEVARRAVSLSEHARDKIEINQLTAAAIARVLSAYNQFVEGNTRDRFADLWQRFDCLKGKPVALQQGGQTVSGTAVGIDDEGSLIVRTEQGKTERFRAGEVSLSKAGE